MTVFAAVIQGLDLKPTSQASGNEQSFMYMMLKECDRYETLNGTADTFSNPYQDVLRRLAPYSSTPAYKSLAALIGVRAN